MGKTTAGDSQRSLPCSSPIGRSWSGWT